VKVQDIIDGIEILRKTEDSEYCVDAEHDQIWAGGDREVSEEDRAKLLQMGWWFDTEIDRWSAFT
jgi:hypothetical protein